jgi:hypothetical protein
MTACIQIQYATNELIHIVSCYRFTLLKEDIKNTWYVELETKVV